MPILYIKLLAGLLAGAVLAGGGYRLGRDLERAGWLELEQQQQAIASEHQRARNAAALAISTASRARASAQRERVRTVVREIPVPVRLGCDWSEPERVRIQSAYDALFGADPASGMPDAVPATAAAGIEQGPVGD